MRAGPRRANDGRPARVPHARRRPARNLSAGARIELAGWLVLSDDKVPRESRSRAGLLEGLERGDGLEWLAVLERLELLGVRPSVG